MLVMRHSESLWRSYLRLGYGAQIDLSDLLSTPRESLTSASCNRGSESVSGVANPTMRLELVLQEAGAL